MSNLSCREHASTALHATVLWRSSTVSSNHLRHTHCLFVALDYQSTMTELCQSPQLALVAYGTVSHSMSSLHRLFLTSALLWRHFLVSVTRNIYVVLRSDACDHYRHVNRFTYLLTYLLAWILFCLFVSVLTNNMGRFACHLGNRRTVGHRKINLILEGSDLG